MPTSAAIVYAAIDAMICRHCWLMIYAIAALLPLRYAIAMLRQRRFRYYLFFAWLFRDTPCHGLRCRLLRYAFIVAARRHAILIVTPRRQPCCFVTPYVHFYAAADVTLFLSPERHDVRFFFDAYVCNACFSSMPPLIDAFRRLLTPLRFITPLLRVAAHAFDYAIR